MREKEIESIITECPAFGDFKFLPVNCSDFIIPTMEDDKVKKSKSSAIDIAINLKTINGVHFGFNLDNKIVVYRKRKYS